MKDMFEIVPEQTIQRLNMYLDVLFACHTSEAEALESLIADPGNNNMIDIAVRATIAVQAAEVEVEAVEIVPVDMITTFKS